MCQVGWGNRLETRVKVWSPGNLSALHWGLQILERACGACVCKFRGGYKTFLNKMDLMHQVDFLSGI